MSNGKLSIIIPVYNAEKYIDQCIESILGQSYNNIEVVIVDDGSKDNSLNKCLGYAKRDKRVHVIHQENQGPSVARNRALEIITGEYLTFVDADDFLPDKDVYFDLLKELENNSVQAVFFSAIIKNENYEVCGEIISGYDQKEKAETVICQIIQSNLKSGGGFPWNKIWKLNGNNVPFFDKTLKAYEDKKWVLEQLLSCSEILLSHRKGYCYIERSNSISHDLSKETYRYWNGIVAYRKIRDHFVNDNRFINIVRKQYIENVMLIAWIATKSKNYELLSFIKADFNSAFQYIRKQRKKCLKTNIKSMIIKNAVFRADKVNNGRKIGVITFQNAFNYGAQLQAYALLEKMKEVGMLAELIDYRLACFENYYWMLPDKDIDLFTNFKWRISRIKYIRKIHKKNRPFLKFQREMILRSKKISCYADLKRSKYDVLISGSDQVWNTSITNNDLAYFLEFSNQERTRKYSYAASFGSTVLQNPKDKKIVEELKKFDKISVREISGKRIVEEFTGKRAMCHCDPTLLLSREQWDYFAGEKSDEKYVFLYYVTETQQLQKIAKELGRLYSCKVIVLTTNTDPKHFNEENERKLGLEVLDCCSPQEFVRRIRDAEIILTNSFHATVFSILFEKQFMSQTKFDSGKENERIIELLKSTSLTNRSLNKEWLDWYQKPIEWSLAREYINSSRIIGEDYIHSIHMSEMRKK